MNTSLRQVIPMVAQFRSQFTKELGEGAEPPPVGEAPWNRFLDLLRLSPPFGTAFGAISGRKCSLEVVPNLGARCAAPWRWFQTPFPGVAAFWKWFQADFPAARRLGSRSTPISRLRHASRKIFGGAAASLRTDIRSCHKYSHFLAATIWTR